MNERATDTPGESQGTGPKTWIGMGVVAAIVAALFLLPIESYLKAFLA